MIKRVKVNTLEIVAQGTTHDTANCGKIRVIDYKRCDEVLVKFLDSGIRKKTTSQIIRAGRLTTQINPKLSTEGRKDGLEDALETVYVKYQASLARTEELRQQLKDML